MEEYTWANADKIIQKVFLEGFSESIKGLDCLRTKTAGKKNKRS